MIQTKENDYSVTLSVQGPSNIFFKNNPHNVGMPDIFQDRSYQLDGIVVSGRSFLQFS